jgi:hypothetical protein
LKIVLLIIAVLMPDGQIRIDTQTRPVGCPYSSAIKSDMDKLVGAGEIVAYTYTCKEIGRGA